MTMRREKPTPLAIKRRGLMFVLSSPSGAGKSSIARGLLENDPCLSMSISVTTRPIRPSEIQDKDYHFVTREVFKSYIDQRLFLEHAQVFDHFYGTLKEPVDKDLHNSKDVLFDIDWQGAKQLKAIARQDLVSLFILPPSYKELDARLRKRGQDTEETIQKRMAGALAEISHWAEYDYVLINENLEETISRALHILEVERLKRSRQTGLAEFVKTLKT